MNELLALGADPNVQCSRGNSLHLAANRGSIETVERLLQAGAHIDAQDSDGGSPAMIALLCCNEAAFIHLMQAGARLDLVRNTGETVLNLVTWAASTDVWSMITERAHAEKIGEIQVQALHNEHELFYCFDHCRELWFVGKREEKKTEDKFCTMIDAFRYRFI